MKKISKILLVLLMLVAAAFTAMACNAKTVDSISVESGDMPLKTVYIIGTDTEFSPFGGTLTVHYSNGDEETVSLEDSRVSFSGFNPDKIGSQKITVSFEGKTCEITVRVINRFTLSGVETNYFVGENLSRAGKLVLTKDDGTTQEILFNDPSVTVEGANGFSATEGEKTIKISYGSFSEEVKVQVYKAAKVQLDIGRKSYMSHVKQLDLSTARLSLQNQASVSGSQGAVKKEIPLTKELLKSCGVDDEKVFADARQELNDQIESEGSNGDFSPESFVSKDIKFTYAGQDLSVTISVYLSRQTYIMYYADKYAGINYAGEEEKDENGETNSVIKLTSDQENAERVTYVAQMYFDLTDVEKTEVEAEKRNDLVKLAGYHWYLQWLNAVTTGEVSKTLILNYSPYSGASLTLDVGGSYQEALETRNTLKGDALKEVNAVLKSLWQILGNEELSNLEVYKEQSSNGEEVVRTLKMFLSLVVAEDEITNLMAQLDNVLELYEGLDGVTLNDVKDYYAVTDAVREKVSSTLNIITADSNQFKGNRPHYAIIKNWNPIFFDILYQYYWNIAQDEKLNGTTASTNAWNALVSLAAYSILPSEELENFYGTAVQLLNTMTALSQQYSYDATELYYYYNLLMDHSEKLDNIDNELYKGLYEKIGYSFPIISEEVNNYVTISYAMNRIEELMVQFLGVSRYIPEVKDFLDYYVGMYAKSMIEGTYENIDEATNKAYLTQEFKDDVSKLINDFFAMSPAHQYIFMNTISAYDVRLLNIKSYSEGVITAFTGFIASYYNNILSEDALTACDDLMFAYECYLRRETSSTVTNIDRFFEYYIQYGRGEYNALGKNEQETLKLIYDTVTEIYGMYDADQKFIPVRVSSIGDRNWQDKFTELNNAVKDFYTSYAVFYGLGVESALPFISSYLRVERIYNDFMDALENETNETVKAKVLKLLEYGEFDVIDIKMNNQIISDQGNIDFVLCTTWNAFLNFCVDYQFDISGIAVTTGDLFNEKLNPGFKQMFVDMQDFIVQAQYLLFNDKERVDFSGIDNAGETFRKFFAAPDEGYSLDQKNVLYYMDSMRGTISAPPFTLSAISYYAEAIQKVAGEQDVKNILSASVNYIALVESYIDYYSCITYDVETLDKFSDEDLLAFQSYLSDSGKGYDEALTQFNALYQAFSNAEKELFHKFFNEASISFFSVKPRI